MNLILDPWIPVVSASGWRTIRPDQIGEAGILFPDWPRADLNIACLELLIGLVALADPPADPEEWEARRAPDPDRLRERLAPFAAGLRARRRRPAFPSGPRAAVGSAGPPDMLFIDCAGESAAKKNADLMVWRDRYPGPGAGARGDGALHASGTCALGRGGQPHLHARRRAAGHPGRAARRVQPLGLVWANVPCGARQGAMRCPGCGRPGFRMRAGGSSARRRRHSARGFLRDAAAAAAGVRRRTVTGVIQRPLATNYGGWQHPLTPYYRLKAGRNGCRASARRRLRLSQLARRRGGRARTPTCGSARPRGQRLSERVPSGEAPRRGSSSPAGQWTT